MKLTAKIFITGTIITQTGLHIGGSKSALDIGGIDLNVIKTAPRINQEPIPYIPGSSLKGKLRSMIAKKHNSVSVKNDPEIMKSIFGAAADKKDADGYVTRLLVRDSFLNEEQFKKELSV